MSEPTYAEEHGKKPFDWSVFLKRAITREVSKEEMWEAQYLAARWVTCACGNQCSMLPRFVDGEPKDEQLSAMGSDFNNAITCKRWRDARGMLKRIEGRSDELLAAMHADQP